MMQATQELKNHKEALEQEEGYDLAFNESEWFTAELKDEYSKYPDIRHIHGYDDGSYLYFLNDVYLTSNDDPWVVMKRGEV